MDRLELLKYKGQNIAVYQLGNDRLQFGILTDVKDKVCRLNERKFGPSTFHNNSIYAVGDGFA